MSQTPAAKLAQNKFANITFAQIPMSASKIKMILISKYIINQLSEKGLNLNKKHHLIICKRVIQITTKWAQDLNIDKIDILTDDFYCDCMIDNICNTFHLRIKYPQTKSN